MQYCTNHPAVEASELCGHCRRPFCDACLVDFLGGRFCGACRDLRLQELQRPGRQDGRLVGTGRVEIGHWLSAGWNTIAGQVWLLAASTLVAGLTTVLTCYLAAGAMQCGLYLMILQRRQYSEARIDTLFTGFRRFLNALGAAVLLLLVLYGAYFGVASVQSVLQLAIQDQAWMGILFALPLYALGFVVELVFAGSTLFVLPHIAVRNAGPVQAISASWSVYRRNPLMFSLAALAFGLVAVSGTLLCGVGVFFTLPWALAAVAEAYADHFGVEGFDAV